MARNQVESCMFCGNLPCTCHADKPKQPRAKLPTAPSVPKQAVQTSPVGEPRRTAIQQTDAVRRALEEERVFRQAVTLLCESGLVSADSVQENLEYLDLSPLDAKLLIWKLKRNEWRSSSNSAPGQTHS